MRTLDVILIILIILLIFAFAYTYSTNKVKGGYYHRVIFDEESQRVLQKFIDTFNEIMSGVNIDYKPLNVAMETERNIKRFEAIEKMNSIIDTDKMETLQNYVIDFIKSLENIYDSGKFDGVIERTNARTYIKSVGNLRPTCMYYFIPINDSYTEYCFPTIVTYFDGKLMHYPRSEIEKMYSSFNSSNATYLKECKYEKPYLYVLTLKGLNKMLGRYDDDGGYEIFRYKYVNEFRQAFMDCYGMENFDSLEPKDEDLETYKIYERFKDKVSKLNLQYIVRKVLNVYKVHGKRLSDNEVLSYMPEIKELIDEASNSLKDIKYRSISDIGKNYQYISSMIKLYAIHNYYSTNLYNPKYTVPSTENRLMVTEIKPSYDINFSNDYKIPGNDQPKIEINFDKPFNDGTIKSGTKDNLRDNHLYLRPMQPDKQQLLLPYGSFSPASFTVYYEDDHMTQPDWDLSSAVCRYPAGDMRMQGYSGCVHLFKGVRDVDAVNKVMPGNVVYPLKMLTVGYDFIEPDNRSSINGYGLYTTTSFDVACLYADHLIYHYECRYKKYAYTFVLKKMEPAKYDKIMSYLTNGYDPRYIEYPSEHAIMALCVINKDHETVRIYILLLLNMIDSTLKEIDLKRQAKRKLTECENLIDSKIEEMRNKLLTECPDIDDVLTANEVEIKKFADYYSYYMERGIDIMVSYTHGLLLPKREKDYVGGIGGQSIEEVALNLYKHVPCYEIIPIHGSGIRVRDILLLDK